MKSFEQHKKETAVIAKQIKQYSGEGKKLRFYHGGNNSTRSKSKEGFYWVDISHLDEVIAVNTKDQYALVEPNVPMDKLVETTLQYGLIPPVVMEFPGITVGGGVNGTALESSSFRYGQFGDVCEQYEIVLGNGNIIKASKQENKDIFYGMSGAYGSLGLISLVKLNLIPASAYVHVKYQIADSYKQALKIMEEQIADRDTDYLEGIVFSLRRTVIMSGKLVKNGKFPIRTYSKAKDPWFYESAREVTNRNMNREELVPITDYLFRYNRGAFWTGEFVFPFLHIPNNKLTRYLLNPVMNTRKLFDGLHAVNMGQDWLVQDFYIPWNKVIDFIEYSKQLVSIWPLWLCPMKPTKTPQKLSPHFINTEMLMDIGVWGHTEKYLKDPIRMNREHEHYIKKINGRKMLYAHQYYTEEEFWKIYDERWYKKLRLKYKADIFPDVWQKTHVAGRYKMRKWRGVMQVLWETLQGKHINT